MKRSILEQFEIRSIDEQARTAEFVAATENPVQTYRGAEVLLLSGLSLARFKKNPVVLDTHDRGTAGAVIGNARVSKDTAGRRLLATITFAKTERAETVWELVRTKFIRALSVGFAVDPAGVFRVAEGETYDAGGKNIAGPAVILKRTELFEISVVPVPADADALARARSMSGAPYQVPEFDDEDLRAALTGQPRRFPPECPVGEPVEIPTPNASGNSRTLRDVSDDELMASIIRPA